MMLKIKKKKDKRKKNNGKVILKPQDKKSQGFSLSKLDSKNMSINDVVNNILL